MVADEPQNAAAGVVHLRLERLEEFASAGGFMSLMATADFFDHGPLAILLALGILLYGRDFDSAALSAWLAASLAALAVVWALYRLRPRLVLVTVIVFTAAFSLFNYRGVMDRYGFMHEPTVPAWLAFAGFLAPLAYVDYLFLRAAWNVSRITGDERAILRGKATGTVQGLLLRLFGIPEICAWLPPWQRRAAVLMFFISTALFCVFVRAVWFSLFTAIPGWLYGSREIWPCFSHFDGDFCARAILFWLQAPFVLYPALFAAILLLVAGARYAARRFTRVSLERLISADPRPPILFLRSFRDDQVRLHKPGGNPFRRMVSVGEPRPTLDHVLLEQGTPRGPVIAIGAPGKTPPFGAARAYVNDAEWRDTVAELSRKADAVVITIDETEGVRWEVQHLLGHDHVKKTLFLLSPRLMAPEATSRSLAIAFAEWGGADDLIAEIARVAREERRLFVGWLWRDDGRIELLTTRRNSYLAYVMAVRVFLSRWPERAASPLFATTLEAPSPLPPTSPPPVPASADASAVLQQSPPPLPFRAVADAPVGPRLPPPSPVLRKPLLGAGIFLAFGAIAALLLLSGAETGGDLGLPLLFTFLARWVLGRTGLPRPLAATLSLSIGECLWGIAVLIALIATGDVGEQVWGLLIDLAIFITLVGWVFKARSRVSMIVLLVFQICRLAIQLPLATVDSARSLDLFVHLGLSACQVAASIYAITRLKPSRAAAAPQTDA